MHYPFLSIQEGTSFEEARPHLIEFEELYSGMRALAYKNCSCTDEDDFAVLQKVIERGIDLARGGEQVYSTSFNSLHVHSIYSVCLSLL